MLDPQALIKRVSSHLKRVLTTDLVERGQTASISIPLQELRLRSLPKLEEEWLYWNRPTDDETIIGLGNTMRITASGPDRFETLNQKLQEALRSWKLIDLEQTGFKPLSFFCFAFSPADQMEGSWGGLPNSGLFLPEITLQQSNNCCVASFSVNLGKNQDIELIHQRWIELFTAFLDSLNQPYTPPGCRTNLTRITTSSNQNQWRQLVTRAQAAITNGVMEKVVPARQLKVQAERMLDPRQLMATLNYLYPNSTLLATRIGKRTFVSATPERLASYLNGEIRCDATAGTIHRSAVEERDHDLGQLLLSNPKTKHEHQLVIEDIKSSLSPICSAVNQQERPSLLQLRNLQHIYTEIKGQLNQGINLLQAAARIHPTAAVNGYPGPEASQWLKQNEPIDRGWYAGTAGWIDCQGNGELAVLLRCALLDGDQADLFAGAGITAGSDADAEFAETELKFSVMLEALENA